MNTAKLTRLEGTELKARLEQLQATIAELRSILDSDERQLEVVLEELAEVRRATPEVVTVLRSMQTYGRPEFVLERGNGVYLFDTDGGRYLDFVSGLAVNAFGYGEYDIVKAIEEQAGKLMHVSNLYHIAPQNELAALLVEKTFADRAFFCNSGAEANEGLIKLARIWGSEQGKYEVITMRQSFHGRTLATLTATGQEKVQAGFGKPCKSRLIRSRPSTRFARSRLQPQLFEQRAT